MTEYPKRISIPSPDRLGNGVLVPQPPVVLTVKNAAHEAQWLPPPNSKPAPGAELEA